jgi:hypothetical protein
MGASRDGEYLQCLLEPPFVLQEVRIGGEAEPKPRRGLWGVRHLLRDAGEVCRLGSIGGERLQMTADGVQLPYERVLGLRGAVTHEHASDQATDDISAERQPRRLVALARPLGDRAIEESAECQNAGAVLKLAEELLRRKQRSILPSSGGGDRASIAHLHRAGKGVRFWGIAGG